MSLLIATIGVMLLTAPALVARLELDPASQVRLACTAAGTGVLTLAIGAALAASVLVVPERLEAGRMRIGEVGPVGVAVLAEAPGHADRALPDATPAYIMQMWRSEASEGLFVVGLCIHAMFDTGILRPSLSSWNKYQHARDCARIVFMDT